MDEHKRLISQNSCMTWNGFRDFLKQCKHYKFICCSCTSHTHILLSVSEILTVWGMLFFLWNDKESEIWFILADCKEQFQGWVVVVVDCLWCVVSALLLVEIHYLWEVVQISVIKLSIKKFLKLKLFNALPFTAFTTIVEFLAACAFLILGANADFTSSLFSRHSIIIFLPFLSSFCIYAMNVTLWKWRINGQKNWKKLQNEMIYAPCLRVKFVHFVVNNSFCLFNNIWVLFKRWLLFWHTLE